LHFSSTITIELLLAHEKRHAHAPLLSARREEYHRVEPGEETTLSMFLGPGL
jgi:hypothetical protein